MDILHFKHLGNTENVVTNAVWVLIKSLTILYVASDTSPLYQHNV